MEAAGAIWHVQQARVVASDGGDGECLVRLSRFDAVLLVEMLVEGLPGKVGVLQAGE